MRSKLSLLSLAVLLAAFFVLPASAHNGPNIQFGIDARLPQGCTAVEADEADWGAMGYDLECTAEVDDTFDFSIIIEIPTEASVHPGMGAYSFGAQWDTSLQNALTVDSATQGTQSGIELPGPPPVTIGYSPLGGAGSPIGPGGVSQSTDSAGGQGTNWEALSNSPDSAVNVESAGASFRAGRISVTVNSTDGTSINLGWYNSLQDSWVTGGGSLLDEDDVFFAQARINDAPEPGAALSVLAGIASLAFLARGARRSR